MLLTHWNLNEIARDPPLIPWHFLEYFRASERTKINHMHSKHRYKIRFQDVFYSKLNKWRAKILKNINKKTSTWCVMLIKKQEIILFLYRVTKCPTKAEKIEYEKGITVLCKSNANDNRRISRFILAIYRRYIRETSHGLANVKTINLRDIGTIFVISRRDIVLARLRYNDISQSKTINRHNISLQRSSL